MVSAGGSHHPWLGTLGKACHREGTGGGAEPEGGVTAGEQVHVSLLHILVPHLPKGDVLQRSSS